MSDDRESVRWMSHEVGRLASEHSETRKSINEIKNYGAEMLAAVRVLQSSEAEHKRVIEQIYQKDLIPLTKAVNENTGRIAILERANIDHLEDRVTRVERLVMWLIAISVVGLGWKAIAENVKHLF